MSEAAKPPEGTAAGPAAPVSPNSTAPPTVRKRNPAFKAMGLPNFKWKLPSRNWLIFLSVTGTFTSLLLYDRYYKKKAQKKWCDAVAHIAKEPLGTMQMPRKLTIFISAPPGDGPSPSREYFKEYIKPILVAAALDYDVVEGRREGDVRSKLADMIRIKRRRGGEPGSEEVPEDAIADFRRGVGISQWNQANGDLIIGRHTWKEYIRGLHEGWLGPLVLPPLPDSDISQSTLKQTPELSDTDSNNSTTASIPADTAVTDSVEPPSEKNSDGDKDSSESDAKKATSKEDSKPRKFAVIPPEEYSSLEGSPNLPRQFEPSAPICHTHILGFLNTPARVYRFLRRRYLADEIGRETTAIVFAASRPYTQSSQLGLGKYDRESAPEQSLAFDQGPETATERGTWEQQTLLKEEEPNWHKSVQKPNESLADRPWLEDVAIDPRIAARMRKFELEKGQEERAQKIAKGEATVSMNLE